MEVYSWNKIENVTTFKEETLPETLGKSMKIDGVLTLENHHESFSSETCLITRGIEGMSGYSGYPRLCSLPLSNMSTPDEYTDTST